MTQPNNQQQPTLEHLSEHTTLQPVFTDALEIITIGLTAINACNVDRLKAALDRLGQAASDLLGKDYTHQTKQ